MIKWNMKSERVSNSRILSERVQNEQLSGIQKSHAKHVGLELK